MLALGYRLPRTLRPVTIYSPQCGFAATYNEKPMRLTSPVGARIADNFLDAVVNRNRTGVGLHREPPSDIAVGHAVAVRMIKNGASGYTSSC